MASGVADCNQRTHKRVPRFSLLRRWRKGDSGMTAVEFGLVAMPFMMLLFGIISICLYFFTNFTLENAVWHTARALRTGQVQQAKGAYSSASSTEDKKNAFKAALCALAPHFLNCNKVVVIVQSSASFGGIVEPKCATNGVMVDQSAATFNTGTASSVILVTVCYPWDFGGKLPFIKIGNLQNGAVLLQASVAFRTEPYN
jgi:Flp pilus assembly protein TadG